MRADRLVSILLLLQTHKRLTGRELATRLEVSERTIHRDMEALSASGIPIVAERGSRGGWELLEPYQTNLTGLNNAEIQALFLTTPTKLLTDLGLRQVYDAALIKLQASLPFAQRQNAADLRERILVDTPGWHLSNDTDSCFPIIQDAVLGNCRLSIVYERSDGTTVEREVNPLGLVAKGRLWYLVAAVEGEPRTYRVSRIQSARIFDFPARRPPEFNLAAFWAKSSQEFVANLPRYPAQLRIHPDWIGRTSWWRFAHVGHIDPPDDDGWYRIAVDFEVLEEAAGCVLSFGPFIKVIEPEELNLLVREWARLLLSNSG
jgi:predicted DNA-binding transcriptional regulator YafY